MLNKVPIPISFLEKINTIINITRLAINCILPKLSPTFAAIDRFINVHGSVPRLHRIKNDRKKPIPDTAIKHIIIFFHSNLKFMMFLIFHIIYLLYDIFLIYNTLFCHTYSFPDVVIYIHFQILPYIFLNAVIYIS